MSKIAKVNTIALKGLVTTGCTVEAQVFDEGIGIHLIGVADHAVKGILLRVLTALQSAGYSIPGKKIVINISPAITEASDSLDFPVALALLSASGAEELPLLDNAVILGQLGLDASVRDCCGSLQAAEHCAAEYMPDGICILPTQNAVDAFHAVKGHAAEGVTPYGVDSLQQAVAILNGDKEMAAKRSSKILSESMPKNDTKNEQSAIEAIKENLAFDEGALRAAEIAAAGGFGVVCSGPEEANPGNFSLLIHSLLPPLDVEARYRINQYLSYMGEPYGKDDIPVPFKSIPAHVADIHATHAEPGACVRSSEGILSITDADRLSATQITALTQARESRFVTYTARAFGKKIFHYLPSEFQPVLVVREGKEIKNPLSPSSMFLTEMSVELHPVPSGKGDYADILFCREKVEEARRRSVQRDGTLAFRIPEEEVPHMLDNHPDSLAVLRKVATTLGLSKVGKKNLILIARVISDLDRKEYITPEAIGEAAGFVSKI